MPRNTSSHASDNQDGDAEDSKQQNAKRSYLPQIKMPSYSLEEALRIPQVIGDEYAFKPTPPLKVAKALNVQPTTTGFRMLTSAAMAYGLTEGSYGASVISVTSLALRILKPSKNGDDILARREAFLKPSVPREFLARYNNNKLPREEIAKDALADMGVSRESLDRTLKLIINEAKQVGLLEEINGAFFVTLQAEASTSDTQKSITETEVEDVETFVPPFEEPGSFPNLRLVSGATTQQAENRRVFITHGKNKSFIEPLKDLLSFGELEPIVSIERESVSQTISDKIMDDMRNCRAAIIHIEDEQKLLDSEGNQQIMLNPNVLIEIGAAMALYGKKFILLVKSDIKLPSNLQGLYEVRYEGNKLDGEATIRLLKAIKDMKNQPLPTTPV